MKLVFVSEEHISDNASKTEAERVVELMRAEGWAVLYGERPWQFPNEEVRQQFEATFEWALAVMRAERSRADSATLTKLARQRVQMNEALRPYEQQLMVERPQWEGYWRWLIESPTKVILDWLASQKKEDVPQE